MQGEPTMKTLKPHSRIRIHGFVMLRGLEDTETYELVNADSISYWFRRVLKSGKLSRKLCRHRLGVIDHELEGHPEDINRIELLK